MRKAVIGGMLATAAAFLFVYLIGSFCAVSFDLSKWDTSFRYMVGIAGGIVSAIIGGIVGESFRTYKP